MIDIQDSPLAGLLLILGIVAAISWIAAEVFVWALAREDRRRGER